MTISNNIFVADVGDRKIHVYDGHNEKFYPKLPLDNLIELKIPNIKSGDCIVVEDAHIRESHKLTMAQPYDWEKLVNFYKNAKDMKIDVLLFPQKSTPKARKLCGFDGDEKSDEIDTKSIYEFINNNVNVLNSLKKFNPIRLSEYQEKNKYVFDYISEANDDINEAKSCGYGFNTLKNDYEDQVSLWIKKYSLKIAEYLEGDENLLSMIGIEFDKKGKLKTIKKPNRIYTLVHSIIRPNGDLRLRKDFNCVPYWKYVKSNYFGCKPYHMRQGVSASNYKHWMRKSVSGFDGNIVSGMSLEDYQEFKKSRSQVDKDTRKIWRVLRKMIVEDGLR
jgi:hypothetical protein